MQHAERLTRRLRCEQFLEAGSNTLSFAGARRKQIYAPDRRLTLLRAQYLRSVEEDKGIVRRYLGQDQRTRSRAADHLVLIRPYRERLACLEPRASNDGASRAATLVPTISLCWPRVDAVGTKGSRGPRHASHAIAGTVYGKAAYQRLAAISCVPHLQLAAHAGPIVEHHVHHTKTRARGGDRIGERRKPDPRGRPGYLRVDTVHQGDTDSGTRASTTSTPVDTVTQWVGRGLLRGGPFASRF